MPMTHRGSVGHVYVARVRGVIKVGFTEDVARRMKQTSGELIATAPGSFADETAIVAACSAHRSPVPYPAGREWFTEDVLPTLDAIWQRTFGTGLPAEPEPDLEDCNGGCGEQVDPNAVGIAWCGQVNCRSYAEAEYRADAYGGT